MSGVLCVITLGEVLRLVWCVDNWATLLKVTGRYTKLSSLKICAYSISLKQMQ